MATARARRHTTARSTAGWWSVAVLVLAGIGLVAAPPAAATGRGHAVSVSAPASVVAGVPFDVTVTVRHASRHAKPYLGTVRFGTDDPLVRALPRDYTFTRADRGTHTFTGVTLVGTGTRTLTVRDTRHHLAGADRIRVVNAEAAIEGQVLSNFDPVEGGVVTAYDAVTGLALKSGPADIEGYYYRITGLPAGDIKVGAVVPGPYLPDFANDRDTLAEADVFTLHAGETLVQSWDSDPFWGPYLDVEYVFPPETVRIGDDGVVVATAVNEGGTVVGYHYGDVANEYRIPFVWQDGVTTDLEGDWQPCDVNDRGEIVGDGHPSPAYYWKDGTRTLLAEDSEVSRITAHGWTGGLRTAEETDPARGATPYVWRDGVRTDLDVGPQIRTVESIAAGCGIESPSRLRYLDVNDRGTFLGLGTTADGKTASFVVERGRTKVLRDAWGVMQGLDLNDAGQVAGSVQSDGQPPTAAIWTKGRIQRIHVPGLAPGTGSWATAVNERGDAVVVTGEYLSEWPLGSTYAWHRGKLSAVGPEGLASFANRINDAGQVAGVALVDATAGYRQAFVWQRGGLTMLGDTGQGVAVVVDLSERGHVLAQAYRPVAGADTPYALMWTVAPLRR